MVATMPTGSKDLDGKEWKIVRDGSIHPECRRRSVLIGETYKVELNSPKLEYGEMEKLQEVVRSLRRAGGIVNDSCGMHVHVDAKQAHAAEPQKCAVHHVFQRGHSIYSLESQPCPHRQLLSGGG